MATAGVIPTNRAGATRRRTPAADPNTPGNPFLQLWAFARPFFSPGLFTINVLMGLLFVVLNFERFVVETVVSWISFPWLAALVISGTKALQEWVRAATGPEATALVNIMTVNFLLLKVYLALLVTTCLLRLRPMPIISAVLAFVAGVLVVHLLSYSVIVVFEAASYAAWAFAVISAAIAAFITWVFQSVGAFIAVAGFLVLFYFYPRQILRLLAFLAAGAIIVVILAYVAPPVFAFLQQIARAVFEFVAGIIGSILAFFSALMAPLLAFVTWLLSPVTAFIQWLVATLIAPVLAFALTALLYLLIGCVAGVISATGLATVGNLVTDQVRSAFRVRRIGLKSHGLNGFALGSALALVFLAAAGAPVRGDGGQTGIAALVQVSWMRSVVTVDRLFGTTGYTEVAAPMQPVQAFAATMPTTVLAFARTHLAKIQAPLIDAVVLTALLILSCTMVIVSLFATPERESKGRQITFFPLEVLAIVGMVLLGILLLFASVLAAGGGE
jgi:hypothetical protein